MKQLTLPLWALLLALIYPCTALGAEGIFGWWKGVIEQPIEGKPPYRYVAIMTAMGDRGKIDYPGLGCGGELSLEQESAGSFVYREHIRYGQKSCADGGLITISPVDTDSMKWTWKDTAIRASGTMFGPVDWKRVAYDKKYHEQKNANVSKEILDTITRMQYFPQPGDGMDVYGPCVQPSLHAMSMFNTLVKNRYDQETVYFWLAPGKPSLYKDDPFVKGVRFSAVWEKRPWDRIFLAGHEEFLKIVQINFEIPAASLSGSVQNSPERATFETLAEVAVLVMELDWNESAKWISANLGKKAKMERGFCDMILETLPPDPKRKHLTPVQFTIQSNLLPP